MVTGKVATAFAKAGASVFLEPVSVVACGSFHRSSVAFSNPDSLVF